MELQTSKVDLLLDVDQKPELVPGLLLSLQHVFAMFGATVLVPLILGMPVSVALFASGLGTLIYMVATQFKVPVYLGSSFAFLTAMQFAMAQMDGKPDAAQTGVVLVGLLYVVVAIFVKLLGTNWINRLLPPIVIGPMIIVIGLGLANSAVTNAGFVKDGDWKAMFVAVVTFLITAFINTKAKGFLKIIPFLFGIIGGYNRSHLLWSRGFHESHRCTMDCVAGIILTIRYERILHQYNLYFGPETWAILPVAVVTIAEHIGDHTVLSEICGRQFLKDPGLHRTLIGDGGRNSRICLPRRTCQYNLR